MMDYPVQLQHAEKLGDLRERCVVFHGVNKSGSLVMSDVMRAAYATANRSAEVHSVYHRDIKTVSEALSFLATPPKGHGFVVGHDLYGAFNLIPDRHALITQFRHPLPRVVSCHRWITNKRIKAGEETVSIERYIEQTRGIAHSQIAQFGIGFRPEGGLKRSTLTNAEVYERAKEAIERDVAWFGIAEFFEESIFINAHLCGLGSVRPWKRDNRNQGRTMTWDLPPKTVSLIEDVYHYDFELYAYAKAKFLERIAGIDFGPCFSEYKAVCAAEYKDRIL